MTQKNQVAKIDNLAGEFLKTNGKSLETYAIREYDKTAFLKSAMICISDNAALSKAVSTPAGKTSLFNALRYAASTGLSLNPQEGKAALVAFGDKIQYQIMKNGMIDLAMDSGKIEFITSDLVRQNDDFSISKSMSGDEFTFKPSLKDRGPVIGFFAALKMVSGSTVIKWMTVEEVKEFRDSYSAMYKSKPDYSPWKKSFNGMGLKTAMKALLRSLSISPAMDAAIGSDDFYEADFTVDDAPEPKEPGNSAEDVKEKIEAKAEKPKSETKGGQQGSLL